jgi:hypothetical protein
MGDDDDDTEDDPTGKCVFPSYYAGQASDTNSSDQMPKASVPQLDMSAVQLEDEEQGSLSSAAAPRASDEETDTGNRKSDPTVKRLDFQDSSRAGSASNGKALVALPPLEKKSQSTGDLRREGVAQMGALGIRFPIDVAGCVLEGGEKKDFEYRWTRKGINVLRRQGVEEAFGKPFVGDILTQAAKQELIARGETPEALASKRVIEAIQLWSGGLGLRLPPVNKALHAGGLAKARKKGKAAIVSHVHVHHHHHYHVGRPGDNDEAESDALKKQSMRQKSKDSESKADEDSRADSSAREVEVEDETGW